MVSFRKRLKSFGKNIFVILFTFSVFMIIIGMKIVLGDQIYMSCGLLKYELIGLGDHGITHF